MSAKNPQTAWKNYTAKELSAQFDLSARELAECAAEGLILPPASRHKGPPYTEMDYLRLNVFKRCTQAGYGLTEVLDLIGRIHRRTAPIKTVILAKAFASDKIQELESQMAESDALEQINLRCDADILNNYIEDLALLQGDMGATSKKEKEPALPAPSPNIMQPEKRPTTKKRRRTPPQQTHPPARPTAKPQLKTKPQAKMKRAYPRVHGSLAEDSHQLWKHASPGGRIGWMAAIFCAVVVLGGYLFFNQPKLLEGVLPSPQTAEEPQIGTEDLTSEAGGDSEALSPQDNNNKTTSPPTATTPKAPLKKIAATKKKPAPEKVSSLTREAASDLQKIMAASGKTAAATNASLPRVVSINELVAFYDIKTRILRVKIELLKNLLSEAPEVISGRIFMLLRPVEDNSLGTATSTVSLPSLDPNNKDKRGVAFSLEDGVTTYLKTRVTSTPALEQNLTIFIFDHQNNVLLRESRPIKLKLVRS